MTVIEEIAAERRRQIEEEGWTPAHDDEHDDGSLADVAACYAMTKVPLEHVGNHPQRGTHRQPIFWPQSWSPRWWKPKDRRHNLKIAAALIVAEIERLDREAAKHTKEST